MQQADVPRGPEARNGTMMLLMIGALGLGGAGLAIGSTRLDPLLSTAIGHGAAGPAGSGPSGALARLGLTAERLTPAVAIRLGLPPAQQGVVVTSLSPTGPLTGAGAQVGDVIIRVNDAPVAGLHALARAVPPGPVPSPGLRLDRVGTGHLVTVRLRAPPPATESGQ